MRSASTPRDDDSDPIRVCSYDITELEGLVPQLSAYFRRARAEMPPEMRDSFEAYGLGPRHGAVLTQLLSESSLSIGDLASRLGVSLPAVSEIVADLVRSGWVQRCTDPNNRRRALVSLDPRHHNLMTRYAAIRTAPITRALQQLSEPQQEGFMAGLRAWVREAHAD